MTFTRSDVMAAIESAVAANPEGLNPMSSKDFGQIMCLNRSDDPDASTPRCIASQVHFDLTGRELEGANTGNFADSLRATHGDPMDQPFDLDARSALGVAQVIFDRCSKDGRTWTEGLADFKAQSE